MEDEKTVTTAGESTFCPEENPAPEKTGEPETTGDARLSWEEILSDPVYKQRYDESVSRIVQRRLRSRQEAETRMAALAPVFEALRERYGEQDEQTLAESIRQGESLYAPAEIESHLDALLSQAASLRETDPSFDLMQALEDPRLLRLTAPHSGVELADAWYALHRGAIREQAARESLKALSRSVQTQARRTRELHGGMEGSIPASDPRSMSKQEREALKKRILEAKAQGRALPLGD